MAELAADVDHKGDGPNSTSLTDSAAADDDDFLEEVRDEEDRIKNEESGIELSRGLADSEEIDVISAVPFRRHAPQ